MRVASGSWRARCALARGFKFSGRWYLGRVFGVDTPQLWDEHLAVTRVVADHLVTAFDRMIARGVARADAQRSILAGVRACFAEELGVAPRGGFAAGLADGQVLSGLRLVAAEVVELQRAAELDWSRVQPRIFGALFQASMDRGRRHALGAHFTERRRHRPGAGADDRAAVAGEDQAARRTGRSCWRCGGSWRGFVCSTRRAGAGIFCMGRIASCWRWSGS
jgi:hypothetical protein